MTTISELYEKAKRIDLEELFQDTIIDLEDEIVGLNQRQLTYGKDSELRFLDEYRSIGYAVMKNRMNSLAGFGNPDLKLSGDFYKGFYVYAGKNAFLIDSSDSKTSSLIEKYGQNIFGLDKDSLKEFVEIHFETLFFQNLFNLLR